MKRIILLFLTSLFLIFSTITYAYIETYHAEISDNDRYNSGGDRLYTVRSILRQERANVHRFGGNGQYEGFFASKSNRDLFDSARINISPGLAQSIVNGDVVYITVRVISPNLIEVNEE